VQKRFQLKGRQAGTGLEASNEEQHPRSAVQAGMKWPLFFSKIRATIFLPLHETGSPNM
jgi:hypothetical protein